MKKLSLLSCLLAFVYTFSMSADAQNSTRRKVVTRTPAASVKPVDGYWSAQRNLETALAALESFVNSTASDDPRRQTADDQIQMLREIRLVPNKNPWSLLVKNYLNRAEVEWRVASVETNPDRTRANLEIRNTNPTDERCFRAFNDFSLIDNRGRFVPMLRIDGAPRNVRIENVDGRVSWCLTANQVVMTTADFAPLAQGTTSGQITYREDFGTGTKPIKFSLFQQKIK